jgi:CheY-like chemotaxis protein
LPALERIEDASEQANGVIRSLLTFSRRAESVKAPVEIGALIDVTSRILNPMLQASVDVVVDHPGDSALWVEGDVTQLQQALMNLALNANEAMPDGGRLLMRAWSCSEGLLDGTRVLVEVSDTGEGMKEETVARIFEPFFTTRAPGQGTGLGLSLVHGIIADHGGHVRVESEPGRGSSFIINLPAVEAPLETSATLGTLPSVVAGSGLVVLVEDHQHVREILAESLETAKFEVVQTTCGQEFLEAFEEHQDSAALLVADVDIPAPSGVDCIRRLREGGVEIPAIVITGTPAPGLESELEGVAVVLRKPFTMAKLVELASSLVEPAPV